MAERDPGELADRLEHEADDLARHSNELGQRTEDAAQDWQRKRSDPGVPGAPPPEAEGEDGESTPTGSPTGKGDDE